MSLETLNARRTTVTCPRCGKNTNVHIMSMFNTQDICLDCAKEEKKSPHYEEARQAEVEACKRGDFNFPGIGLKR